MFHHQILLFFRNIKRSKSTFIINLIGLSTGLSCTLLIYFWVVDELSIDEFHEKDGQLFQVMSRIEYSGTDIKVGESTPFPLAKALAEEMPEVAYAVPIRTWTNEHGVVVLGDKKIRAVEQYVGQDFFNVFSYPLLQGDKNSVLTNRQSVLLSEEMAEKLFHTTENVVGKSIEWQKKALSGLYTVSGIFKKPPTNSTSQFDVLFSFDQYLEKKPRINEWKNGGAATYIVLNERVDVSRFNKKIESYLQTKSDNLSWTLFISRYSDQHLYGNYDNGIQIGGRIEYVRLFSIIAAFILVLACINFMNLSTARASKRIKEIGIKKVIGVDRKTLIFQFLSETVCTTLIALSLALALIALLLPQFNEITGKQLKFIFDPSLLSSILLILFFTALLAGSYPALYLSSFEPVKVLKGTFKLSLGGIWGKGLVGFQFIISIILIVGNLVVYNQIEYIQAKNLGYQKAHIIFFQKEGKLAEDSGPFLQELKKIPGVVNASAMWGNMTEVGNFTPSLKWEGKNAEDKTKFGQFDVDYNLIETLGITLKSGRAFSQEFGNDDTKIILNQEAVRYIGWEDPLGKVIRYDKDYQVIGIVNNFHLESLYEPVKPIFMILSPYADNIVVKIQAGEEGTAIPRIEQFYRDYNQGLSFNYKFLDKDYEQLYLGEQQISKLSRYFAVLAILISCLGLYGLASITVQKRIKEVSIRKILGSNVWRILYLLSFDFTKMVLIAIAVALPFSYLISENWLNSFAYRIEMQVWFFLGAGLVALLITWITIGFQVVKVARVNLVQFLREE